MTQALRLANPDPWNTGTADQADTALSDHSMGREEWLSLDEVARRSGRSPGHLRRMAGDKWLRENKARHVRPEKGLKRTWEIRAIALTELGISLAETTPEKPAVPASLDLRSLTAGQRAVALERQQIVQAWMMSLEAGRRLGFNSDQSTAQFLHRHHLKTGKEINRSTLYKWRQAFQRQGLVGLVDRRSTTEAPTSDDPFLQEVARLWLRMSKPKMTICYEMATLTASDKGWQACSYRSVVRHLNSLDKRRVHKLRGGESEFVDLAETFVERDYSTIESNEIWVADHHRFDVLVKIPGDKKGRVGRPWITAWMDMRSRMIVGYIIRFADPNTDVILEVFHCAVLAYGVPKCAYTDNGKDFDSQAFTGETKKQRRARIKLRNSTGTDEQRAEGIYSSLGIKHIHAIPFHGQSKPIERWFRTLEERWGVLFDTYCGSSPDTKPACLEGNVERGLAPSLEDFTAEFGRWLTADYHQRVHTGDSMDGMSPAQCYESNLKTKRTAPAELLDVLLQRRVKRKVGQNGVEHEGLVYGQHVQELRRLLGQNVYLRVNSQQINQVSIWTEDDKFVAIAPANGRVPANATSEDFRASKRTKSKDRKIIAQASGARMRLAENLHERLARTAAARNRATQEATGPTAPTGGPTIQPVRSPVEASLIAIGRSKKAAGAENLSQQTNSVREVPILSEMSAVLQRTSNTDDFFTHGGDRGNSQVPIWNRIRFAKGESSDE